MARLGDLREKLFRRLDWAPEQSPEAKVRVNEFINDALEKVSNKVSGQALFETEDLFHSVPPHSPADTSDTVSVSTNNDPWVIQRDTAPSTLDADDVWPVDGRLNGRWLHVQSGDKWYSHRIRDVWTDTDVQYITLWEPQDTRSLYSSCAYYIDEAIIWLPENLVRPKTIRLYEQGRANPLHWLTQKDAEQLFLKDTPGQVNTGHPSSCYRWGTFQMPAPATAPAVADEGTAWTGTLEPKGTFQYCYTWCWGYRDLRRPGLHPYSGTTPLYTPLHESAPSPPSSATSWTNKIDVTFPLLDALHGFNESGTDRYQHCGWYTRIYRKRVTISGSTDVEATDRWHPIADVDGSTATWEDSGIVTPSPHETLPQISGYLGVGMYPRPDDTYPMVLRYARRPTRLVDDADVAPIDDSGDDVIIETALAFMYEKDGDHAAAAIARSEAKEALRDFIKNAKESPGSSLHYRRAARPRSRYRTGYRKWWD